MMGRKSDMKGYKEPPTAILRPPPTPAPPAPPIYKCLGCSRYQTVEAVYCHACCDGKRRKGALDPGDVLHRDAQLADIRRLAVAFRAVLETATEAGGLVTAEEAAAEVCGILSERDRARHAG